LSESDHLNVGFKEGLYAFCQCLAVIGLETEE